jgi:3-methyladenine DNA glycosylase AlkD
MRLNHKAERHELLRRMDLGSELKANKTLQSYLGSPYPVFNVSVPRLRTVVRDFANGHKDLVVHEINVFADLLWRGRTFNEKALAIELLQKFSGRLDDESWGMLDRWVDACVGWGLCDSIGSGPISSMAFEDRAKVRQIMSWTESENFWRRRVAAYASSLFVRRGELDIPFRLMKALLYDSEFWVQRAAGTWLRECWKKDRARTRRFLVENVEGMPRVTITVATERAPRQFRERLRRLRAP